MCEVRRNPAICLREEAIFLKSQKYPYHATFNQERCHGWTGVDMSTPLLPGFVPCPLTRALPISINLDNKSGGALTIVSAEREPIMGPGAEPPTEYRGRAPGQEVRRLAP